MGATVRIISAALPSYSTRGANVHSRLLRGYCAYASLPANVISVGSAVFARHMIVTKTDTQTDHVTPSVAVGGIYRLLCMRYGLKCINVQKKSCNRVTLL